MKRVVLVDDDVNFIGLVTSILDNLEGMEPIIFTSPSKALDYINNNYNSINLIITDIYMPEISGVNLIKNCKNIKNIPVLYLTASENNHIISEAFNNRDKALTINYIQKPFNSTMLRSAILTLLQTQDYFFEVLNKKKLVQDLLVDVDKQNVALGKKLRETILSNEDFDDKLKNIRFYMGSLFRNDLPIIKFVSKIISQNKDALSKINAEGDQYFKILKHSDEPIKTFLADFKMVADLLIDLRIIDKSDLMIEDVEKTTFYNILYRLYSNGEFSPAAFEEFLKIAEFSFIDKDNHDDVILF